MTLNGYHWSKGKGAVLNDLLSGSDGAIDLKRILIVFWYDIRLIEDIL